MQNINWSIIPTSISALCALVSVGSLIYSNYMRNKEKHSLVRPVFYLMGNSGSLIEIKFQLKVLSNNTYKIKKIDFISDSNEMNPSNIEVIISDNLAHNNEFFIEIKREDDKSAKKGKLILTYINVYEKTEKCQLEINLEDINYSKGEYFMLCK